MFSGTYTSTVGSETTVFEVTVPGDAILVGHIDTSALQSGDVITFYGYIAVDGSNYRLKESVTLKNEQAMPVLEIEQTLCGAAQKVKITAKQTAGTARQFPYSYGVKQ